MSRRSSRTSTVRGSLTTDGTGVSRLPFPSRSTMVVTWAGAISKPLMGAKVVASRQSNPSPAMWVMKRVSCLVAMGAEAALSKPAGWASVRR